MTKPENSSIRRSKLGEQRINGTGNFTGDFKRDAVAQITERGYSPIDAWSFTVEIIWKDIFYQAMSFRF